MTTAIVQGVEQGLYNGDGDTWLGLRKTLEVEVTRFANGLDVGNEGKREG